MCVAAVAGARRARRNPKSRILCVRGRRAADVPVQRSRAARHRALVVERHAAMDQHFMAGEVKEKSN